MEDDKRKYLRFECLIPIDLVEVDDPDARLKEAVIDNVSREGIRLIFDLGHAFREGEILNVKISTPEDEKSLAQVTGEVIWSRPLGDKVEVGLKIKNMEESTKADLLDLGFRAWRQKQQKEHREGDPEKDTRKL
jgi:hypothetical protein